MTSRLARLRGVSLRARFLIALAVLLALIAGQAALTTWQTARTQAVNDHLHAALALDGSVKRLDGAIGQQEAAVYAPSASDPSLSQAFAKGEVELGAAVQALQPYQQMPGYGRPLQLLMGTVAAWRNWAWTSNQAIYDGLPPPPQGQGARLLENYRNASGMIETLVARSARADEQQARAETRITSALLVLSALILAATLGGLSIVFLRSTLAPVLALAERAAAMAAGRPVLDLPPPKRSDEIGALELALAGWQASVAEHLAIGQTLGQLASTADVPALAAVGAELLRTMLDADIVSVSAVGPDGLRVIHRSAPGLDVGPLPLGGVGTLGSWPGIQAIESGRPVISDLSWDHREAEIQSLATRLSLGPLLSQPLRVGGTVTGAVTAVRLQGSPAFTHEDMTRSEPMVVAMAGALRSAQMIDELRTAKLQLEAADQMKNDFMASMSHELRTPLNSVLGFTQLLRLGNAGPLTAKQERYLTNVEGSGRHLLGLINDVLDLAKVEAGRLEVACAAVDLSVAVAEVAAQMGEFAASRGVALRVDLDSDAVADGDPMRVRQVILNLLSNAIKFTHQGGRVQLRVAISDGWATVVVEDTGSGIPAEKLETIFERFAQLDSTRTRKETGTGLGLPLTRQLMALMGGEVAVQSQPGIGSVFTARFTLHSPAAVAVQARS